MSKSASLHSSILGAAILAGGLSSRMGADKGLLRWNGERAVDRIFALAQSMCGDFVLVSGRDYGLPFVADPSPFAGPVSGLLATADALRGRGCTRLLVLAVDALTIDLDDLNPLLSAPSPGAAYAGLPLPMVVDIARLPFDLAPDSPLRDVITHARLFRLPCPQSVETRVRGANTPTELAELRLG